MQVHPEGGCLLWASITHASVNMAEMMWSLFNMLPPFSPLPVRRRLCLVNPYLKKRMPLRSGSPGPPSTPRTCYPFTSFLRNRNVGSPVGASRLNMQNGGSAGNLAGTFDGRFTLDTHTGLPDLNWLQSSRILTLCDCGLICHCSFFYHFTIAHGT